MEYIRNMAKRSSRLETILDHILLVRIKLYEKHHRTNFERRRVWMKQKNCWISFLMSDAHGDYIDSLVKGSKKLDEYLKLNT